MYSASCAFFQKFTVYFSIPHLFFLFFRPLLTYSNYSLLSAEQIYHFLFPIKCFPKYHEFRLTVCDWRQLNEPQELRNFDYFPNFLL